MTDFSQPSPEALATLFVAVEAYEQDRISWRDLRLMVDRIADIGKPLRSQEVQQLVPFVKNLVAKNGLEKLSPHLYRDARMALRERLKDSAHELLPCVVLWKCQTSEFEEARTLKLVQEPTYEEHESAFSGLVTELAHHGYRPLELNATVKELMAAAQEMKLNWQDASLRTALYRAMYFPHRMNAIREALELCAGV